MVFFKTQFAANASVVRHCRKSVEKKPGGTSFKVKAATDLYLGVSSGFSTLSFYEQK